MNGENILSDWKKKQFQPVYWLEGEESFEIDKLVAYAEKNILTEAESGFNLTLFYGRDADWASVVNACRRYPMFAEKQLVILKEAQHMRDVQKLEPYIQSPLPSTIFIVAYKEKKVDGRSSFAKLLKKNTVFLTTKKLYDNQLPDWTMNLVQSKKLTINQRALMLLVDHIGNDLSRINNEIEKLSINLGGRKEITEDDIERYIGVSKEYNLFELQGALAGKDLPKAIRIIQYMQANPKAIPVQLLLPSLYGFFNKVYQIFGIQSRDEKAIASGIGVHPFVVKDYIRAAGQYNLPGTEKAILLLHEYNLKVLGVNDAGTEDASLMKEMIVRLVA